MKKLFAIILAGMFTLSLAACAGEEKPTDSVSGNNSVVSQTSKPDNIPSAGSAKSPLELLSTVWSSYSEEDKFPVGGGDMSEENSKMGEPGKYSISDAAAVDSALGFPAASIDKIDDAASIVHMMNANTFTCGAFHAKTGGDVDAIVTALKENIMKRQWMCGFPDKLVIVTVDDYVVSIFGENGFVDTFKTKLITAYSSAKTVCDEPIA